MDEPTIDLTPLDPSRDRERWERRIAAIAALAAPELARRAVEAAGEGESPALVLLGWFRPALAAAAVLAALSVTLLSAGDPAPPAVTAEALRLPEPVALWLGDEQPPTLAEVTLAVQGDRP
jgi:hypothetical protein